MLQGDVKPPRLLTTTRVLLLLVVMSDCCDRQTMSCCCCGEGAKAFCQWRQRHHHHHHCGSGEVVAAVALARPPGIAVDAYVFALLPSLCHDEQRVVYLLLPMLLVGVVVDAREIGHVVLHLVS